MRIIATPTRPRALAEPCALLLALLPAIAAGAASIPVNGSDSSGVSIATRGFMSAKVDPWTDDIFGSQQEINHHGAYYADVLPTLRLSPGAALHLRLNLQNPSLSDRNYGDSFWQVRGEIQQGLPFISPEDTGKWWRLDAGFLGEKTVGNGLTFKDFEVSGISARVAWDRLSFTASTWTQDYDIDGEVVLADLFWSRIGSGIAAVLWLESHAYQDPSLYLSPYFGWSAGKWRCYGELGIKQTGKETFRIETADSRDFAFAGMAGVEWETGWRAWRAGVNVEARAYGEEFIPRTAISAHRQTDLSNYGKAANNWVDFFASVEESAWLYLRSDLASPAWHRLSLFWRDELLLHLTAQDLYWDRRANRLMTSRRSLNFYWAGLRFQHSDLLKAEALLTNNLIASDPPPDRDYIPAFQESWSRFQASGFPLMELRLVWGVP